ncbi:MAG: polyprenyl synthetase family protein [Cystobacterineae bacterium]|nr:polyprenyl synthetase family protein [Cystobacterineae bacterium]
MNYIIAMSPVLLFKDFLERVENSSHAWLRNSEVGAGNGTLVDALGDFLAVHGKHVRPILVHLFSDMLGIEEDERLIEVAVAAEFIHNASLLHDDVVDNGMFRRSLPTVNARWGNIVSVMGGDLMLSGAALKLTHIHNRLTQTALRVVAEMTHAAIAEVEARGNLLLSIEQLQHIAEGKTGALFGWCGVAASILAENASAEVKLNAFGRKLGVVFQMADDVKDITGADEGKPQFADIQSKTPSLLVLLAAQRNPAVMKRFKEAWGFPTVTRERTRELGLAVMCSGVLDEATELMEREMEAAFKLLGEYAQTPSGARLVLWTKQFAKDIISKRGAA